MTLYAIIPSVLKKGGISLSTLFRRDLHLTALGNWSPLLIDLSNKKLQV